MGDTTPRRASSALYDIGVSRLVEMEPMACAAGIRRHRGDERSNQRSADLFARAAEAELADLRASFAQTARFDLIQGFAVRTFHL